MNGLSAALETRIQIPHQLTYVVPVTAECEVFNSTSKGQLAGDSTAPFMLLNVRKIMTMIC
jgi:hypothetical protein